MGQSLKLGAAAGLPGRIPEIFLFGRIPDLIGPLPFFCPLHLVHLRPVQGEKFHQLVAVDPDLPISFLLGLVKNELDAEVEVGFSVAL